MDGNKKCMDGIDLKNECTSYCETSIAKMYGNEIVLTSCRPGGDCAIQKGTNVAHTMGFEVKAEIGGTALGKLAQGVFNAGASYQWSTTVTNTYQETFTRRQMNATDDTCGHFSFGKTFFLPGVGYPRMCASG